MQQYVADTHALLWYLTDSPRLGAAATRSFDEADAGTAIILVPTITIAELFWANEKLGRPIDFAIELRELLSLSQFAMVPLQAEDILDFAVDASVPEMHDRIIVGVARRFGAPCLTVDNKIIASGVVQVTW